MKKFHPKKSHNPRNPWKHFISSTRRPMATKRGRGIYIQWRTFFHKVTRSLDLWVLQGHVTNEIYYVSTTTRHMAIKLGKEVIYYNGLLCQKSHNPLNTWSHQVTWQIKYVISLLPQCLKPPNLRAWWFKEVIAWGNLTNEKHWFSFITIPIVTKLVRVLTYYEKLLLLQSHEPLITWFCGFDFIL